MRRCATFSVPVAAVLVSIFMAADARAQFTATASYAAPPKIVPGSSVTYTVTLANPPGMITGYDWQWMESDTADSGAACNTAFRSFTTNNAATVSVVEAWTGTYLVQCVVSYRVGMGGPIQKMTSNLLTITVAKPDGVADPPNLKTPTDLGSSITLVFPVTCGGTTCSPQGLVQELIINKVAYYPPGSVTFPQGGQVNIPDDTVWTPVNAPSPLFFLNAGGIQDIKTQTAGTDGWNVMPAGFVYYSVEQRIRILVTDGCGNTNVQDLGSAKLVRTKVNATQWQIERR